MPPCSPSCSWVVYWASTSNDRSQPPPIPGRVYLLYALQGVPQVNGVVAAVAPPAAIPTSWPIANKGRQRQQSGDQPLILFDLNGVLMQHRFDGGNHFHDLRPGVHHLLRLLGHFRCAALGLG